MNIKTDYELGYTLDDGRVIKSMMINIRDKETADRAFDGEQIEILYNLYLNKTWLDTVDKRYIEEHSKLGGKT